MPSTNDIWQTKIQNFFYFFITYSQQAEWRPCTRIHIKQEYMQIMHHLQ